MIRAQLEGYAKQILCGEEDVEGHHGATIGQLSDEMLFYMRSRGISLEEAKKIQLTVFAAEALDIVPEDVSAGLQGWIDAITLSE